ncbi:MAG: PIG-L deacetylase family protein [Vicinamibacterales bacterium]
MSAPPPAARLLVVLAHPDDESLACGATIARAAAAGLVVTIASLSRGDAGPASTAVDGSLGALRARELEEAAHVLGAAGVVSFAHADGMLPWLDAEALVADITMLIRATAADAVITFGADGLYWHPDHIAVHERTTDAVARLGAAAPALYYVTMPPGQMRAVMDADPAHRAVVPGLPDADAFGAAATPPTLVVPCGAFAATKLAALRCHRSQFADSAFAALDDDVATRLLDVEHFHRAGVGATGPSVLDALADASHA